MSLFLGANSILEGRRALSSLAHMLGSLEGAAFVLHRRDIARLSRLVRHFQTLAVLLTAERLSLWDLLQKERALTEKQMARKLHLQETSLSVLVTALEALGFVRARGGQVSLTGFGRLFLGEEAVFSLTPFLRFLNLELSAFSHLAETVQSGVPAKEADIFRPSPYSLAYVQALNRYLYYPAKLFFAQSPKKYRDLIAGSMGVSFAAAFLERHPHAKITFGCLDHLVKLIPNLMEVYGVPEEAVVSCSSHRGAPEEDRWGGESFDLVFLTKKFLLDPKARLGERFAEKAHQVLRPGGELVIWETLYPSQGVPSLTVALSGFQDLMASRGGAYYTKAKMKATLQDIGFAKVSFPTFFSPVGEVTFAVAEKGRG